ncbi:hypothetical protein QE152_g40003 [Popillia japonica]|uniref:Uncharacterized protein n=1 Tax=Popillia japonica TaxID=7064 RepID=A0AAW1HTA8_POPJA
MKKELFRFSIMTMACCDAETIVQRISESYRMEFTGIRWSMANCVVYCDRKNLKEYKKKMKQVLIDEVAAGVGRRVKEQRESGENEE